MTIELARTNGGAGWRLRMLGLAAALLTVTTGCEEEPFLASVSGHDFGDTDPALYAAMGDSITIAYGDAGAPYPDRLAGMLGRTVLNFGVGGARSDDGLAALDAVLARKPGYVLVYYGANDAIHGAPAGYLKENLRAMVQRIQATQAIALLANLTPMTDGHAAFSSAVEAMNAAISDLANELGVPLVDLAGEFGGDGAGLLQPDGLHPNSAGQQVIAEAFYQQLRFTVL